MAAATLQLIKKVGANWEPDGPGIHYEDDLLKTAREKATGYGKSYVDKDPENRQYDVYAA